MNDSAGTPHSDPRLIQPTSRHVVFVVVLAVYIVLILGVIRWSPFLTLDKDVFRLDLRQRYPEWFYPLHTYVMLGQRAPATLVALPWFVWRSWKSRSTRPLVMLATALLVLNLSVGLVKIATGRLGPRATPHVNAVFRGGDIFPSGHVSNAVVLYGLIAMLAVSFRRTVAVAAVFVSVTVGLSTVYLDTHWVSDVLGGWLAGLLVLLALPWVMPYTQRVADALFARGRRVLRRVVGRRAPEPPAPRRPSIADQAVPVAGPRSGRMTAAQKVQAPAGGGAQA